MSGTTIARAASPRGEVVLRRRDPEGALELRVNGVLVMDTAETATERALASLAIEGRTGRRASGVDHQRRSTVLVGGLGLGCTLRELASNPLVDEILVAEIEGELIEWHLAGLVPATACILPDPGITFVAGDVRDIVEGQPDGSLDGLILDVDNGPGFLVYDDNAAVYETPFLRICHRALADGGRLVVWSADQAEPLEDALRRVFGVVRRHETDVLLGIRRETFHTYVACRGIADAAPCPVP